MSRKKNFTAKLAADSPPSEKLLAAIYGDKRDSNAIELLNVWRELSSYTIDAREIERLGLEEFDKHMDAELRRRRVECLERFAAHVDNAVRAGDGSFFRAFADAIENASRPIDWRRALIGAYAKFVKDATWMLKRKRTLSELHQLYGDFAGERIDKDQFRRLCDEMGLPYAKAKTGRPKKSDD